MRLQRYLALCGVASRRHAETLIEAGKVKVNGEVVTTLGTSVDPERDVVEFDGKVLQAKAQRQVWMLHKPKGVITTMHDPQGRQTVADLVKVPGRRLVPVGRLDVGTSGLLLMTDDGDLALRLTHPRWGVEKEYLATVEGTPARDVREALVDGVFLEGRTTRLVSLSPARGVGTAREGCTRWLAVVHEGRYHMVRKLFALVGHSVVALHRTRVGPLPLGPLPRGQSRRLTDAEVQQLREAVGLTDGQTNTDQAPSPAPRDRRRRR